MNHQNPDELIKLIIQLDKKIEILSNKVDNNNLVLTNHINFIERIYDTIKKPFNYLMVLTNNLYILNINNAESNNEIK
jgi:hypothetical protein